jgi:hypothetical protein
VWNGTAWQAIALSAASTGSLFDMGGNRIVNLGNPVTGTDALNLITAEGTFVAITGGTMTGALVLTQGGSSSVVPTVSSDLTNKGYVDGLVATINTSLSNFVNKTGDTVSGTIAFSANASLTFTAGTGAISFGNRVLGSVGTPQLQYDGANKAYVDTSISDAIAALPQQSSSDGVVVSGALDETSGVLTLTRSAPLAAVVVAGNFAPFAHTQGSSTVNYDLTQSTSQSYLVEQNFGTANYPTATEQTVIEQLDQRLYQLGMPYYRNLYLIPSTDPGTEITTISIGTTFPVEYNRVQVFVNGVKQYQTMRGITTVPVYVAGQTIGLNTLIGATAGTYNVSIGADGNTPVALSIAVSSTTTFSDLIGLLTTALRTNNVGASVDFVGDSSQAGYLRFASNHTGAAASGYQVITYNQQVVSTTATGLANTTTAYTTTITVDGTAIPISIQGQNAQTFGALVSQLNTQLGTAATATLQNYTSLVVTSATTGNTSSVSISTSGTLFAAPMLTNNLGSGSKVVQGHAASAVSVSYGAGELLTAIPSTHQPQSTTVQTTQAWRESGDVGTTSNGIVFTDPLALGAVVEVTVFN